MKWLDDLVALIHFVDVEGAFLIFAALFGGWVAVTLVRRGVDPSDLVVDSATGKMEWHKVLACVGGTAFTWGFLHVTDNGTLTEWFFTGFGVICFGSAFAYKVTATRAAAAAAAQVVKDASDPTKPPP